MKATRDRLMRIGQIAEMRFWVEALRRGVIVAKPHEGARYDFLVDCGRRIFRVQVKSTSAKVQRCYRVNAFGGSGIRYTAGEVDILAAYIIPEKEWWIVPLRAEGRAVGGADAGRTAGTLSGSVASVAGPQEKGSARRDRRGGRCERDRREVGERRGVARGVAKHRMEPLAGAKACRVESPDSPA